MPRSCGLSEQPWAPTCTATASGRAPSLASYPTLSNRTAATVTARAGPPSGSKWNVATVPDPATSTPSGASRAAHEAVQPGHEPGVDAGLAEQALEMEVAKLR